MTVSENNDTHGSHTGTYEIDMQRIRSASLELNSPKKLINKRIAGHAVVVCSIGEPSNHGVREDRSRYHEFMIKTSIDTVINRSFEETMHVLVH